ncbi:MAG: prepilin-type N-terminal cleavage/methylation domain-containing protein [Planctomycetota bacterium]
MKTGRSNSGFTLLEIVVVMSILALLVGAVAPMAGTLMRSRARGDTAREMELLAEASLAHYDDTGTFPSDALQLLASSTSGWAGPYLSGTTDDAWSGQSGYRVDGYGSNYRFTRSGTTLTITSGGPDRSIGTADDQSLVVDATPLLRRRTLERMQVVNTAIVQYHSVYLATDPLPATWTVAYSKLVSAGFLPPAERSGATRGDDFVGDPAVTPLSRVTSVNF